jgi:ribose-phosphate pyrophosphokinase
MVDDLITSAGTITTAAKLCEVCGAKDIYVAATHPVFCATAIERINASPIKLITVADTVPLGESAREVKKIRQLSLAKLLGEAISRIHRHESVSQLFLGKTLD